MTRAEQILTENRDNIVAMRRGGVSWEGIASAIGVSRTSISCWAKNNITAAELEPAEPKQPSPMTVTQPPEPWYTPHIVGEEKFTPMVWQDIKGAAMTIEQARAAYDAGTHELVQKRETHNGRHVLIAVPRTEYANRRCSTFGHPIGYTARAA